MEAGFKCLFSCAFCAFAVVVMHVYKSCVFARGCLQQQAVRGLMV